MPNRSFNLFTKDCVRFTLLNEFEKVWEGLPFGTRQREEIRALPMTGSQQTLDQWIREESVNVWNLHSVLTQYVTHNIESPLVREDKGEVIAKTFERLFN